MNGGGGADIFIGGQRAEVLDFSRYGDGLHRVLKVNHEGRPVVVKCYGRKEKPVRVAFRQFGSLYLVGKSSITARARFDTERKVLLLWQREGFDVPRVLPIAFPELAGKPYLVLEWVPGTTVAKMLIDPATAFSRKREVVRQFSLVFSRRHARAVELDEPRLLFENPTFEHVFLSNDRLVHHDFEIVFTRRRDIQRLIRREIVGFLSALAKVGAEEFPVLLGDLMAGYPEREPFERVHGELVRYGSIPLIGWAAPFNRLFRHSRRYQRRIPIAKALGEALNR